MKLHFLFNLMAIALLQLLVAGFANAQVPNAGAYVGNYKTDPRLVNFVQNRSLETIALIPPNLRLLAIADLMAAADQWEDERTYFEVPDRKAIMAQYYDKASAEFKNQALSMAFQLAVNFNRPADANDLYDQILQTNPNLAASTVCNAIATISKDPNQAAYSFSENTLKLSSQNIKAMLPQIAKTPRLSEQSCIIQSSNGAVFSMTIGELISLANPELQKSFIQTLQNNYVTAQTLAREYSSCSLKQIENVMWEVAFQQMRSPKTRVGYINFNFGPCVIRGMIRKVSPSRDNINVRFEFTPEGIAGESPLKPIPFRTYQEIAAALKAQPQAYTVRSGSVSIETKQAAGSVPTVTTGQWGSILMLPFGVRREVPKGPPVQNSF